MKNIQVLLAGAIIATVATSSYADIATNISRLNATHECTECDLSGANMSYGDLTRADLSGADLTGANLTGANLSNVTVCKTITPRGGEDNSGC